jgi:ABC-type transport system involved in multi-copper enzyme maturation permease subunit
MNGTTLQALLAKDLRIGRNTYAVLAAFAAFTPVALRIVPLFGYPGTVAMLATFFAIAVPVTTASTMVMLERQRGTVWQLLTLPVRRSHIVMMKWIESLLTAYAIFGVGACSTAICGLLKTSDLAAVLAVASVSIFFLVSLSVAMYFLVKPEHVFIAIYGGSSAVAVAAARLVPRFAAKVSLPVLGGCAAAALIVVGVVAIVWAMRTWERHAFLQAAEM